MASSLVKFTLLLCFLLGITCKSHSLILPVMKDSSSLQYWTKIYKGSSYVPLRVMVDLGSPSLWSDCEHVSSMVHPVHSASIKCLAAKGSAKFIDSKTPFCGLRLKNSITGSDVVGDVVEGHVGLPLKEKSSYGSVNKYIFSCVPTSFLHGLASGVKGILGLGRSRISLSSQLSIAHGTHQKFSLCLSSLEGFIVLLEDKSQGSMLTTEVTKSLSYTPLVASQDEASKQEYFIKVRSIHVNGKKVSLKSPVETKLSTVVPYTTLQSSIYDMFTEAYMEAAKSMDMRRVTSVAPFEFCFSSNSVQDVPAIDLVLQSEMVKWRIQGKTSMVHVSDEIMCLAFLDGGLDSEFSIVFGGYQLEDTILHFDLSTSMLGFGSLKHKCCSDLRLSLPLQSI